MKKEIGLAMTSLETLSNIMDEDEEHDNMSETGMYGYCSNNSIKKISQYWTSPTYTD